MGLGWQEIDKTLDLCYIRVAGLHRECKPTVLFDPPNFRPHTMTHTYIRTFVCMYVVHIHIHPLSLSFADSRSGGHREGSPGREDGSELSATRCLFVGNIPKGVSVYELRDTFLPFGMILVRMVVWRVWDGCWGGW